MSQYLTQQNLILTVGVLLLLAPTINKLIGVWIKSYFGLNAQQQDFQKGVVTDLLTLKDKLEKEGHVVAAKTCKDLIIAMVYGEVPEEQEKPQARTLFK